MDRIGKFFYENPSRMFEPGKLRIVLAYWYDPEYLGEQRRGMGPLKAYLDHFPEIGDIFAFQRNEEVKACIFK